MGLRLYIPSSRFRQSSMAMLPHNRTDGSNEGFGEHRKDSKISYVSWGYELIVGMITDSRPDARDMDDFETFVKSLKCKESLS